MLSLFLLTLDICVCVHLFKHILKHTIVSVVRSSIRVPKGT